VHDMRVAFNRAGSQQASASEIARAASLSAAKGQRISPVPISNRPSSPVPAAFRKMIDVWAMWIIVHRVH
jgi:hypothetical protein